MSKKVLSVFLGAMTLLTAGVFAQDDGNLLKNSALKFDEKGNLSEWGGTGKAVSGPGHKGANSACLKWKEDPGKATMVQWVYGLKPGKCIFSAYIKLDKKISELVLIKAVRVDGKDDYAGSRSFKAEDQPEPGTWGKIMLEFEIPEGVAGAMFAFDFRDKSGATVWIDSPSLAYKTE